MYFIWHELKYFSAKKTRKIFLFERSDEESEQGPSEPSDTDTKHVDCVQKEKGGDFFNNFYNQGIMNLQMGVGMQVQQCIIS